MRCARFRAASRSAAERSAATINPSDTGAARIVEADLVHRQGFQINNTPAQRGQIFTGLRNLQVDLSNALLVPPTYTVAPQLVQEDVFRVQGVFQMRPISIGFDLYYQWEQGRWKLVGIDLQPLQMTTEAPSR